MDSVLFNKITALSQRLNQVESPQLSFLKLKNFIFNRQLGSLRKRGGSLTPSVTGDIWAIEGYNKDTASTKIPIAITPIRHRRDGATSHIEKYDWSANTWSAITKGSETSFDIGNVGSAAQIDDRFILFCGRPAMVNDIASGDIERLGGPAPTAAATVASGGAGALTGNYRWVYTFYDSASGWESSPSPISSTLALTAEQASLTALPTSADRENVSHKRIYRTLLTNAEPFFFSGQVTLAATSYIDNVTDSNLTSETAPDSGDHNPPPDDVYIGAIWANRVFLAKDNVLHNSLEYDGNLQRLEYFSANRQNVLEHRITGIVPSPRHGGLLLFKPPGFGIDLLTGTTEATFSIDPFLPQEGTNWHKSITVKDNLLTYWGQARPKLVVGVETGARMEVKEDFDDDIDLVLRDYSTEDYSESMFVWSIWDEINTQFLYGFGAVNIDGLIWEELDSGSVVEWEDSVTGETVEWEEL